MEMYWTVESKSREDGLHEEFLQAITFNGLVLK
jgi:hypothetical protein